MLLSLLFAIFTVFLFIDQINAIRYDMTYVEYLKEYNVKTLEVWDECGIESRMIFTIVWLAAWVNLLAGGGFSPYRECISMLLSRSCLMNIWSSTMTIMKKRKKKRKTNYLFVGPLHKEAFFSPLFIFRIPASSRHQIRLLLFYSTSSVHLVKENFIWSQFSRSNG